MDKYMQMLLFRLPKDLIAPPQSSKTIMCSKCGVRYNVVWSTSKPVNYGRCVKCNNKL